MTSQVATAQTRQIGRRLGPAAKASRSYKPLLLALFFLVILLPIKPLIGSQRVDPSRIYLLAIFIPFGLRLLAGKAGRFTLVDGTLALFTILVFGTLYHHHGSSGFSYAVSQVLELYGGYMIGRMLIRSEEDYQRFIRYFLIVLGIMLPLVIYENLTARMFLGDLFGKVFPVPEKVIELRAGLYRGQVVFAHPILYGFFCSLALASVYYIYRQKPFRMIMAVGLVIAATFGALSSAPMLSLGLQTALAIWDKVTRGAWKILGGIVVSVILVLELFSNRGPVIVFIETMTLDPQTGWWRVFIFEFGWQNVMMHPWFGNGLNDWVRPYWMYSASVDNFWLLMAMRHGIPALFLVLGTFVLHIALIARAKALSPEARSIRNGYVITLIGMMFTLTTVHVWDQVFVFVMFFLGAGAFLYTTPAPPTPPPSSPPPGNEATPVAPIPVNERTALPYSRFPQGRSGKPASDASARRSSSRHSRS